MKARFTITALFLLALLIVGTVACNRAHSDAAIQNDVQGKLYADKAIQSRQVGVQSSNGVVTLSGTVSSDEERAAAANDAAQVEGVRTVVNNLQTSAQMASDVQPAETPQQQAAVVEQPKEAPAEPARREHPRERRVSERRPTYRSDPEPDVNTMATAAPAPAPQQVTPPPPPPPPAPVKVTIPDGTTLSVRMIDSVDSATAQPGQVFRASLDSPIVIDDNVVVPAQADVQGRVVDSASAGRISGKSDLAVELFKLSYNGRTYTLHTNQYSRVGTSRGKTTATRGIGGAALGAIIGGLAGGGRGAAIGATVGGGAGVGSAAIKKGQQVKIDSEQVLVFTLQSPLTVTAASSNERGANRKRLED
jgi:outer membrane biosynthesis protein TonB